MTTLIADTIETAAAGPITLTKQEVSKAWCIPVANQTSLSASFNLTSYTDTGAGDGTANLTNAFSTANYGITTGSNQVSGNGNATQNQCIPTHTSASAIRLVSVEVGNVNSTYGDNIKSMSAFGTLA